MALSITIRPAGEGWVLRSPALGADMFFSKGGRAEAAGRALASRLADSGQTVELEVVLRDGAVAGVIPFPATPGG
ncbi:MAG: hypothetical protein JO111_14910 [Caulobacteraceae bacterium]|nr:hypothetical protein [Caulobacteraceae bacterium]